MASKVTIQDIAAALGLSRNTVSKAINGTGVLAEPTRKRILLKAREMGYRQFAQSPEFETGEAPAAIREIALFSSSILGSAHFSASLLDAFQKKTSRRGISLSIYPIREEELSSLTLPMNFRRETTVGIIAIELFDETYSNYLCEQGIPTLFVDTAANLTGFSLKSDILLMENRNSAYTMTQSVLAQGVEAIAFVGDRYHCQSFYERWCGFEQAMCQQGLSAAPEDSILLEDSCPYADTAWLAGQIEALPRQPQAFFCANDYLAINVFRALRQLGRSIPEDVLLYGFDNAVEAEIMEPPLTTAQIPGTPMGYIAAEMLLSRIKHPDTSFRTMYIQTEVLLRRSTQRRKQEPRDSV